VRTGTERRWSPAWSRAIVAGLFSLPVAIYYVVLFQQNPVLAAWTEQNVTPSPPFWLTLVGYGFLVLLAVVGTVWCVRHRQGLFLIIWTVLALVLLYAPFALQRRLMMGLHVPIATLAALGLTQVLWAWAGPRRVAVSVVTLFTLFVGTLFIVFVCIIGAAKAEWPLAMTTGEKAALDWLRASTDRSEVVLAAPHTGLWIPAWAGNRVIYGHPFETIEADKKKAAVDSFFKGQADPAQVVRQYNVHYIFYGPEERALVRAPGPGLTGTLASEVAYSNPEVTLYRILPPAYSRP